VNVYEIPVNVYELHTYIYLYTYMEEAPCRRRLGQRMCRGGGGGLGLFKAAAVNEQLEKQYITQYKDEEELGGGARRRRRRRTA